MTLKIQKNSNIRLAKIADVERISNLYIGSWQHTYNGYLPSSYLCGMSTNKHLIYNKWESRVRSGTESNRIFVCTDSSTELIGFIHWDVGVKDGLAICEPQSIHVDKRAWRQGAGKSLLESMYSRVLELGVNLINLWVFEHNEAISFYEHIGYEREERQERLTCIADKNIRELRYKKVIG